MGTGALGQKMVFNLWGWGEPQKRAGSLGSGSPQGSMDVTKPCEFIGFGAMDVTKPYEFIGYGVGASFLAPKSVTQGSLAVFVVARTTRNYRSTLSHGDQLAMRRSVSELSLAGQRHTTDRQFHT